MDRSGFILDAQGRQVFRSCLNGARAIYDESKYGNTIWLGVAQIWVSVSYIIQGTVKVNDTYFNTSTYNTPTWRRLVMCQEIGHTFGLGHQDENFNNPNLGMCMDYTSDPDGPPSNEHPTSTTTTSLSLSTPIWTATHGRAILRCGSAASQRR